MRTRILASLLTVALTVAVVGCAGTEGAGDGTGGVQWAAFVADSLRQILAAFLL